MRLPCHFKESGGWSPCGVRCTARVSWTDKSERVTCEACLAYFRGKASVSLAPKTHVKTTTTKRHELRLNNMDIRLLLLTYGVTVPPEGCSIYVNVPGGGDWSNDQLDINNETPVMVTWTEMEITE